MSNNDNCPEFNGYNTQICRDQGHSPKFKTKAMYMPLIDITPTDPGTIMTALHQAKQVTSDRGQDYNVMFTADLQLYKVAVNIMWANPEQFDNIVLHLGGMHTQMSFIGSIGSLMTERSIRAARFNVCWCAKDDDLKKVSTKYEGIEDCSRRSFKANFDRWHSK